MDVLFLMDQVVGLNSLFISCISVFLNDIEKFAG